MGDEGVVLFEKDHGNSSFDFNFHKAARMLRATAGKHAARLRTVKTAIGAARHPENGGEKLLRFLLHCCPFPEQSTPQGRNPFPINKDRGKAAI